MPTEMYRADMVERKKLYREDLADMAGIKVTSLGRAKLPERDGTDIQNGHARPFYYPSTVEAWLAARPGKAWRKGRTGGWPVKVDEPNG